jgi:nucleoside-diphosphate kinase
MSTDRTSASIASGGASGRPRSYRPAPRWNPTLALRSMGTESAGLRALKAFVADPLPPAMAEDSTERTLVLLKPDAVQRGLSGEILHRIERKGLTVVAARMLVVTPELAGRHYFEHKGKPFYDGLVQHITSGPILALAIEGRSSISVVRLLIGATNPQTAAPGTVRGDLASSLTANLIHASDSPASAKRELELFFRPDDYHSYTRSGQEFF